MQSSVLDRYAGAMGKTSCGIVSRRVIDARFLKAAQTFKRRPIDTRPLKVARTLKRCARQRANCRNSPPLSPLRRFVSGSSSSPELLVMALTACRKSPLIALAIGCFLLRPAVLQTAELLSFALVCPIVVARASDIGFARGQSAEAGRQA